MRQAKAINDPLLELIKGLKDKNHPKMKKINIAYRSYMYTFRFMSIILNRLREDYKHFYEAKRIEAELLDPHAEPRALTPEEREFLQKGEEKEFGLYLDIEDFFIHASVLMYKASRIACLLLGINSHKSFNKHKDFFIKNSSFLNDDKYAKYIRNNTDWFEKELKQIRDDFIVHGEPYFWFMSFDKNGFRVSKGTASSKQNELEILLKLKDKYKEKLPEIEDVKDNLWQILAFLEQNSMRIEEKDAKRLINVRRSVGRALPSIGYLTEQIFEYLNFINKYFTDEYNR